MSVQTVDSASVLTSKLSSMREQFPMHRDWGSTQFFHWDWSFGGKDYAAVGLASEHKESSMTATGSMCKLKAESEDALEIAYFEMLERAACLLAARSKTTFSVYNLHNEFVREVDHDAVFPRSPYENSVYSLSNGVAIGASWVRACEGAYLELVERDAVLRSWFRRRAPQYVPSMDESRGTFKLRGYFFSTAQDRNVSVVGVFMWRGKHIVTYGFAGDFTRAHAHARARRECIQRAAFLEGEDFSAPLPKKKTSPEYHQEFYSRPEGSALLQQWLNLISFFSESETYPLNIEETEFVKLHVPVTTAAQQDLYCVRAVNPHATPLFFGEPPEGLLVDYNKPVDPLHPIA